MKRCLGWSLLLMAGILLGVASSSYQTTHADPPAEEAAATTRRLRRPMPWPN